MNVIVDVEEHRSFEKVSFAEGERTVNRQKECHVVEANLEESDLKSGNENFKHKNFSIKCSIL